MTELRHDSRPISVALSQNEANLSDLGEQIY